MPTYDYECPRCGITFEHFQGIKEEPLRICIHPEGCKHPDSTSEVKRQIGTGAGIIFKGSGFYATDYRSKEYRDSAKRDGTHKSVPVSNSSPSNGSAASTSASTSSSATTATAKTD